MDPLETRLTAAGSDWRDSQPQPPDLQLMVARLDARPRRGLGSRFAFVLVAGLLALSAIAAASGVGGLFRTTPPAVQTAVPSSSPDPTPSASSPIASPIPTGPSQGDDAAQATALLDGYEAALVAGDWQGAFDMLGPGTPARDAGSTTYASEREAFFRSVQGRYTIGSPTQELPDWATPLIVGADRSRAYLLQVDYPALAGNNAGFEQFVVAPDAGGIWRIWPVR
jgi:hypothetical protein